MTLSARPGMAVLQEHIGALISTPDEGFLGTVFPIHDEKRLYLGARHTLPTEEGGRMSIAILRESSLQMTQVEEVEVLQGQPDVLILRAADGASPLMRFAGSGALLWEDVYAAGFPEHDIRQPEPGMRALSLRALKGTVTRTVEAGGALGARGPAYEVSFAIPSGMSGGPVFLLEPFPRNGLVGVCLGNNESTSTLWQEEREEGSSITRQQGMRVIEYGLVAMLHRSWEAHISLAGASLVGLLGTMG